MKGDARPPLAKYRVGLDDGRVALDGILGTDIKYWTVFSEGLHPHILLGDTGSTLW